MTIEELYNKERANLFLFAFRIIHDEEASQDIVQNAFTYMLEHDTDNPDKQVLSIVKSPCLNYLRDRKETEPPDNTVHIIEVEVKLYDKLYSLLKRLPKHEKDFMDLYLADLTPQEITKVLGISYKTERNRKNLILNKLKKML
jgi:RNA polymerase sigma factor (sigma-70 family)